MAAGGSKVAFTMQLFKMKQPAKSGLLALPGACMAAALPRPQHRHACTCNDGTAGMMCSRWLMPRTCCSCCPAQAP
jgi:hypothetical protein